MAWSEHIHIHIHNESDKEIISLLKEIRDSLKSKDENVKQEIMDKLNKAIADIKQTI